MSQIGYSKAWQDAFGLAAGAAGLQIVAVYQDVSQISKQFGDAWQTIVQNCRRHHVVRRTRSKRRMEYVVEARRRHAGV
jgi:type IV secretory pathway TraG/TraD family ATPase VirD4